MGYRSDIRYAVRQIGSRDPERAETAAELVCRAIEVFRRRPSEPACKKDLARVSTTFRSAYEALQSLPQASMLAMYRAQGGSWQQPPQGDVRRSTILERQEGSDSFSHAKLLRDLALVVDAAEAASSAAPVGKIPNYDLYHLAYEVARAHRIMGAEPKASRAGSGNVTGARGGGSFEALLQTVFRYVDGPHEVQRYMKEAIRLLATMDKEEGETDSPE